MTAALLRFISATAGLIFFIAMVVMLVACDELPMEQRQRCAVDPNPQAYDCEDAR